MFVKLAFRNVRRQLGNYLIYFMTVSITVALMFAVNNVIYSPQMLQRAELMRELKSGLIGITVFVSLIVSFVLGYATSFMLKLRKREFGMYLTLGMNRRNILSLFVLETMLLGFAALITGIILGLFLYQGLMLLLVKLLEIELLFAAYSGKGFLLTAVLVACVFVLSSLSSAVYLKKVSVYTLLHADKVSEKKVKHPVLWLAAAIFSFGGILWSCAAFYGALEEIMKGFDSPNGIIFGSLTILAVSIILFHIALAKSLLPMLLKSETLCAKGTNTFTFRQLSSKLQSNSVMAGFLAFLIAFAIIGANCSFVQKVSQNAALDRQYPFDITGSLDPDSGSPFSEEEAERIIGEYAQIEKKISYRVYTSGSNDLYSFTKWSGEGYEGLHDTFLKESDYNLLLAELGRDPIALDGEYIILANIAQIAQVDFSDALLNLNGKEYRFAGTLDDMPLFSYFYFLAVIPDEAAAGMETAESYVVYDLKDEKYDAAALRADLTYSCVLSGGLNSVRCDYELREYGRLQNNSITAIFVVGALYIAIVFILMVMAILALKTLSGLAEDRRRYELLCRLGSSEKERSQTLFRQIFSFFALPFVVPLLLSIPTAFICSEIMKMGGFGAQSGEVIANAGIIALVTALIYFLYFVATYLISKKNVVPEAQNFSTEA